MTITALFSVSWKSPAAMKLEFGVPAVEAGSIPELLQNLPVEVAES